MKIFANKNIWKKLLIIFLTILCLGFSTPKAVQAGGDDDDHIGGTLMKPICSLIVWAGDGITGIMHKVLIDQDLTIVTISKNGELKGFFRGAAAIIVAVAIAGTGIGLAIAGVFAAAQVAGIVVALSIGAGIYAGVGLYNSNYFDNDIDIPLYSISPEEMFKGEVPFVDVNFFNPNVEKYQSDFSDVSSGWQDVYEWEDLLDYDAASTQKKNEERFTNALNKNEKYKDKLSGLTMAMIMDGTNVQSADGGSEDSVYVINNNGKYDGTYKVIHDASGGIDWIKIKYYPSTAINKQDQIDAGYRTRNISNEL